MYHICTAVSRSTNGSWCFGCLSFVCSSFSVGKHENFLQRLTTHQTHHLFSIFHCSDKFYLFFSPLAGFFAHLHFFIISQFHIERRRLLGRVSGWLVTYEKRLCISSPSQESLSRDSHDPANLSGKGTGHTSTYMVPLLYSLTGVWP